MSKKSIVNCLIIAKKSRLEKRKKSSLPTIKIESL